MPRKAPIRAYSYIRFSSPQQAEGGSLKRQTDLTRAYCERKGLVLDDSLTLTDLGTSAFRGDNVREGALAGFLEACRSGRVARGSYLIVESLDRLSRDQIRPALQLFLQLQDHGIWIVTHEPAREYNPDATDALSLIEPLVIFARAHEESAMKSHRRRDGWRQARDRARQGGGPMLKTCPAWLEVTPEGFRVLEERAAVVRRIFTLCREGLGVFAITGTLMKEGVPPFGDRVPVKDEGTRRRHKAPEGGRWGSGKWTKAYVYRILAHPAAMGTYQPQRQEGRKLVVDGEPIPAYYPSVVTEEEWQDAQRALRLRAGELTEAGEIDAEGNAIYPGRFRKGGKGSRAAGRKSGETTNLFSGLVYCCRTGNRMHIVNAAGRKGAGERKRYHYLTPTRETGQTGGLRIACAAFEGAILSSLKELTPADVVPDKGTVDGRKAEADRLSGRLLDIEGRLERAKQRAKKARDFDTFLDLIEELQQEHRQVSERLAELEEEAALKPGDGLAESQTLIGLLATAPAEQRPELRRRLKCSIAGQVSEIWVALWDVTPGVRAMEAQIIFRTGKVRGVLMAGPKYGRYRGTWSGMNRVLAGLGEAGRLSGRLLRAYTKDPETRAFFEEHWKNLNPVLEEIVTADLKARAALDAAVEAGLMDRRAAAGSIDVKPRADVSESGEE